MDNKIPKIAIVGYGSMGKEVEKLATAQGFQITDFFDIDQPFEEGRQYDFDVAVDFTAPDVFAGNARKIIKAGKSIVVGTTGWFKHLEEIREQVNKSGTGLVYGSNFSPGMAIFFEIVRLGAALAGEIKDYDIFLNEIHHKRKKDSPSGTALALADIILRESGTKKTTEINPIQGAISPEALHIGSLRGGEVTGTHTVYFDSAADTIELTHRAKNRSGFAAGALLAAKWIYGKSGVYEFSEVIKDVWNK